MSGPPVFVVGAPRSGTTLLRRLLNQHPELHLTFEASFFSVCRSVPGGISDAEFRRAWMASLPVAWQRVHPQHLSTAVPEGLPARDPAYLRSLMEHCARRVGKVRFGDKSPLHVSEVGSLLAAFPDARVVHIVRDPVAVVRSLWTVPWSPQNLLANALTVRSALEAIEPHRPHILELRLEDFLADRPAAMKRVLEHCELPWSDRCLEPEGEDDAPPVPWLTTQDRDRGQLPNRPALEPADAYRISRVTAPQRARYGYAPLAHVGRSMGGHLRRALVDLVELRRLASALWALQRTLKQRPRPSAMVMFDAVNGLHPDALLACSSVDRERMANWFRASHPSG